jgi:uncharacterized protein (TIGR03067 family)
MKTVCTLGLALLLAGAAVAEDKKAVDPANLVGDWTYVSGVRAGENVPKDNLVGTVTFTKDTVTVPAGGDMKFLMGYKIDAAKSPATIDLEIKDGPVKEGKAQGLIALEGDTLKLCYSAMGKRPEKFESTKENMAFYFTLKKKK